MPEISDVMDVTIDELSPEQQAQLKDAIDQFQQKCLMSFSKNRSGVPYLKPDMPRVLLPGEPDTTSWQGKQEALNAFREAIETTMGKHHTAFLQMFKQMMIGVFGPGMEKDAWSSTPLYIFSRGWRDQFCSTASRYRSSTATAKPADPASSTKHWESTGPTSATKHWESASLAASTKQ
jgi:hypothetical protein